MSALLSPDEFPFTPLTNLTICFYVDSVPFTREVIEGKTSLGGSESACLGLARALAARGHDVHVFATQLTLQQGEPDTYDKVQWHAAETLPETLQVIPPDVFVALRMPTPFNMPTGAGLNLLWNQDMLMDVAQVGAALSQVDMLVYVSKWHQEQWRARDPKLFDLTRPYITRNGYDPALIPTWPEALGEEFAKVQADNEAAKAEGKPAFDTVEVKTRKPYQFIHISRPERGMEPLMEMWPAIRKAIKDQTGEDATLKVCRYDSMYDAQGWGRICAAYDRQMAVVQNTHGGIEWLGQLSKPQLYDHLTESTLMLYPGIHDFGETSCIAAIEAQACGCVFVGSHRGALPETVGAGAGILIEGDAKSEAYQKSFVEAVTALVCTDEGRAMLKDMQAAGLAHVNPAYTFPVLAAEWEKMLDDEFVNRYENDQVRVMRNLLRYDHHVAALLVANDIIRDSDNEAEVAEAERALERINDVLAQRAQTAEDYGARSMDTALESRTNGRFDNVLERLKSHTLPDIPCIIDVACGNGSFILQAMRQYPEARFIGLDFSNANITKAKEAIRAEFGDAALAKVQFATPDLHDLDSFEQWAGMGDVVWCGEYLEHTVRPHLVIDALESLAKPGIGLCYISTPHGPLSEMLPRSMPLLRGHTHHFQMRDIATMFADKKDFKSQTLHMGATPRGEACHFWLVEWRAGGGPAKPCDHWHTILTTRPYQTIVAGLLVRNVEEWIVKCLDSIWHHVDTIVVLDTGSTDKSLDLIRLLFPGDKVKIYKHTEQGLKWPEAGFAAARNLTMKLARDWNADYFMWIDADEHLLNGSLLHQHLLGIGPYSGYVARQQHMMSDFNSFEDRPCRVFRMDRSLKFYGDIHEQPETAKDEAVVPCLDLPLVKMVHYGYETEPIRRAKLLGRNLPMLQQEVKGKDPREMAFVFLIRDLVNVAGYEGASEQLNEKTATMLRKAIALYRSRGFDKPENKFHHLAWPSYQLALKWLGLGLEIEWAFGAAQRLQNTSAGKERILVFDVDEGQRLTTFRIKEWLDKLRPVVIDCTPASSARGADVEAPKAALSEKLKQFKKP